MLKLILKLLRKQTKFYEISSAELALMAREKKLFRRELLPGRNPVWNLRGKRP